MKIVRPILFSCRFVFLLLLLCIVYPDHRADAANGFRDTIRIVGSSTVFPFAAFVAEKYYRKHSNHAPVVESTGSGGGIKMFCAGIGQDTPDIVNASRRMKISEVRMCGDNKVTEISEIMIGWDGIVLAKSVKADSFNLTREMLWKALAKNLPIDGHMVPNPHKLWSHVDRSLPDIEIKVFGPPPTSGTRDVFVEEVMQKGCLFHPYIKQLTPVQQEVSCGEMREDGVYVQAGEDDDLIVRRLSNNPKALGIMGYNTLERRPSLISAMSINGIEPGFETIREGTYPLARPLFLYVKKEHLEFLPQINDYLQEFMSDAALGEDGYLTDNGLIPLKDEMGRAVKAQVLTLSAGQ
jgi:phosphate transport system substrate-binding protein